MVDNLGWWVVVSQPKDYYIRTDCQLVSFLCWKGTDLPIKAATAKIQQTSSISQDLNVSAQLRGLVAGRPCPPLVGRMGPRAWPGNWAPFMMAKLWVDEKLYNQSVARGRMSMLGECHEAISLILRLQVSGSLHIASNEYSRSNCSWKFKSSNLKGYTTYQLTCTMCWFSICFARVRQQLR